MVDLRWTLDEVCLSCDKHDEESRNRTFSRLRWAHPFGWEAFPLVSWRIGRPTAGKRLRGQG